jgi:hypothetical protein
MLLLIIISSSILDARGKFYIDPDHHITDEKVITKTDTHQWRNNSKRILLNKRKNINIHQDKDINTILKSKVVKGSIKYEDKVESLDSVYRSYFKQSR